MPLTVRSPDGVADYRALAELLSIGGREAADPQLLQAEDANTTLPAIRRRAVAVDSADNVVGTSQLRYQPWMPAGERDLFIVVAPAHRRHGIGAQLYSEAATYAQANGATTLVATLSDRAPEAQSFAEHQGFTLKQHWIYWELALDSFQEAPFLPVLHQAQARGIRFLTLADAGNTPEAQRKLYDLNRQTSLEAPGEDSFPSFDEFVRDIVRAAWFRPDSQIVAAHGERWVGLGAVGIDGQRAFNAFTGVERAYRRQGLALALTLLTIRYARQHNATRLEVFNDSRNTPMFKLQERLGYYRIPGRYIVQQALEPR
jgi:GNAT superfamily N-acetyltransferase